MNGHSSSSGQSASSNGGKQPAGFQGGSRTSDATLPTNGHESFESNHGDHGVGGVSLNGHHGQKMSGGADIFLPSSQPAKKSTPTPMDFLTRNSEREDGHPVIVNSSAASDPKESKPSKPAAQQPIGTRNGVQTTASPKQYFTTDMVPDKWQGSRYLKVLNIAQSELRENGSLATLSEECGWKQKLHLCEAVPDGNSGKLAYHLCFNDFRDAEVAFGEAEMMQDNCKCGWVTSYSNFNEFMTALGPGGPNDKRPAYYTGQVVFVVKFNGPTTDFTTDGVKDMVRKVAASFGEIKAFEEVVGTQYPDLKYRVEFFKISASEAALDAHRTDPHTQGPWLIFSEKYTSKAQSSSPANANGAQNTINTLQHATPHRRGPDGKFWSPTGRTAWIIDEHGNKVAAPPDVMPPQISTMPFGMQAMVNTPRGRFGSAPEPHTPFPMAMITTPRSASWTGGMNHGPARTGRSPIPEPQAVSVEKIRAGHDVRTTVMLRNIPNRMGCAQLKFIIDEVSMGRYDFSYLRIDFAKGTNVGYAFVNFVDPDDIVKFVLEYLGHPWVPGSRREVELSYATIQGYDCLIEKFRNSAIMDELEEYRPKIFYTTETAPTQDLIGAEMAFPSPNNPMKHQRSHDNAGQVGLFPPRAAGASGGRNYRSQFDRGTPAQMQEEWFAHQMSPQNGGFGYGPGVLPGMAPRMAIGPPPPFHANGYGMGYPANGMGMVVYNGGLPAAAPYNGFDSPDPFYTGNGNNAAPNQRTTAKGNFGGHANAGNHQGGAVQYPPTPNGMTDEQLAAHRAACDPMGYNETPGPHYYPRLH